MSHFAVTVLISPEIDPQNADLIALKTAELLAPFDENGEWFKDGSRWDWWVIGGRWNGYWDPSFNADLDPKNYRRCNFCGGSGTRGDMVTPHLQDNALYTIKPGAKECNACGGTGYKREWTHHHELHPSCIMRAGDIPAGLNTFALITPDGRWYERGRMGWFGSTLTSDEVGLGEQREEDWILEWKKIIDAHADCTAVLVDCHV